MDVDQGMYRLPSQFLLVIHLFLSTETRASSLPVRLLPFSLVPGITINSPLFLKAVSIISKQIEAAPMVNGALDPPATSLPKGKKKRAPAGKYLPLFFITLSYFIPSDPLSKMLNGSDKDIVAHARDVVANSIMAEVAKEDPQGQAEYKDAVRHQVIATFQRIRVLLLVLDTLMETYNATH